MKGIYEDFPEIYHGIAFFSSKSSPQTLQRIMFSLFYKINRGDEVVEMPMPEGRDIRLMPEIGVADALTFNFIDEEEKRRWLEILKKRIFETLDFIWIARYYVSENGKNRPLKFDYYMLRFIFKPEGLELRVHHEKGARRLHIEDLIKIIVKKLNQELKKEGDEPLNIKSLGAF